MNMKYWLILILASIISSNDAQPTCKFKNDARNVLECAPDNRDYVLRRGLVSDNNKTSDIILKDCKLSDIEKDAFEGLPSLRWLDLSKNKLQKLPLGIFDEATELTHLNISYNSLIALPPGLFDHISGLLQLDLTGNLLENLLPGTIKKVSMLYLSNNRFVGRDLTPDMFGPNSQINFLLLSHNDMLEASHNLLQAVKQLVYLNFEHCLLSEVPKFLGTPNLKSVNHLTLSGNHISTLFDEDFSNLDDLEVLNLTDNWIENIKENTFKSISKLARLDLSRNKLKVVSNTLFQNMFTLTQIDLSHNDIAIVPVNAFRGAKLETLNLSYNRITYLQNNFCLELKNSGAALSKFLFNNNPWQCACLHEFLREIKKMNIAYDSVSYDGKHVVCVSTREFTCKRQENIVEMYYNMYNNKNFKK